jgi:hypothetical protein
VSTVLATVLGIVGALAMTVLADMVSEEARDRLDHLPHAILRLAALRVEPAKRKAVYDKEWLPELTYLLKGDESRPVTRLFVGTSYERPFLFGLASVWLALGALGFSLRLLVTSSGLYYTSASGKIVTVVPGVHSGLQPAAIFLGVFLATSFVVFISAFYARRAFWARLALPMESR